MRRRSSRALTDEVSESELMRLFEAAKWAPSSKNDQPWRFIYAKKNSESWDSFFDLLTDGNKRWCVRAAVLVVIVSRKNHADGSENRTHSFSAGSAFENMALQGAVLDIVVHPLGGFDFERAKKDLSIPDEYDVDAMIAIGKYGGAELLDEREKIREVATQRKSVRELVMEGKFDSSLR